jgi:hypothetical protein
MQLILHEIRLAQQRFALNIKYMFIRVRRYYENDLLIKTSGPFLSEFSFEFYYRYR